MNTQPITALDIERCIVDLLSRRDSDKSICPSEVARAFAQSHHVSWQDLMPTVRDVATQLARQERVLITQGSQVLDPTQLRAGPIRLRRGQQFDRGA